MKQADASDDVDVIILTGSDPAFSAGLDLKELGSTVAVWLLAVLLVVPKIKPSLLQALHKALAKELPVVYCNKVPILWWPT